MCLNVLIYSHQLTSYPPLCHENALPYVRNTKSTYIPCSGGTTVDCSMHLLFVFVGSTTLGERSALDTTGSASTIRRGQGVVDVLL